MARVFIFAQHIKTVLDSAKKEIEIPEGARISAAAAELIKDNQIQIKTIAPGAMPAATAPQTEYKSVKEKSIGHQTVRQKPVSQSVENSPRAGDELSDEVLEDIVNRVIERFKHLKGMGQTKATHKKNAPLDPGSAPVDSNGLVICRCEEITKEEIQDAIRNGIRTLNGIKRITRAGMGLCQGQTCQRLVSQILSEELGFSPAEVEPTTARGPVRPLRLEVFANS